MASVKTSPFVRASKVGTTTSISPSELNTFYLNPRRGDVTAIAGSLRTNDQYKPITVNVGTFTGRPNEVLAGNHTLMAFRGLSRKAMNSFLVRVGRPIEFLGRINEDTTAYCVHGNRGELFLTPTGFQLNQLETQSNDNGLTTIYQQYGTYLKSMYSVMMSPSFVRIRTMGPARRIHHQVKWLDAVPQIVSERYRKTA